MRLGRLDLEHRTETQLRNVLKVEEDCIRGGVLPVLQRSHTRQCAVLNSLSETVESLRAECNAVETQKSSAVALAARRNACVASVNNVYQTMRTQERARDELARAQTSLKQSPNSEAQRIHDDTTARCAFCCAVNGRNRCHTPACQQARATPSPAAAGRDSTEPDIDTGADTRKDTLHALWPC